ncbi:hypothetical protein [Paenibacillus cremeus]|uniref:Alginate lyase domain-containing protein n=1 Tax=Paenibacillus cremeus TaxID=2163881 RepID=A0A559JVT5_9BACL|nr:hypothetical protein [Paenibacillus cremeus]TVY03999.1 hypothetical protein FPZ49_30815 [Paenibacillus cremeus]
MRAIVATASCILFCFILAACANVYEASPPGEADTVPKAGSQQSAITGKEVAGQMNLYESAKDPLFVKAFYEKTKVPDRPATYATGANVKYEKGEKSVWLVEEQRSGAELIEAGLYMKNRKLIDEGWKTFAWAFAKQGADGGFLGTGDPYHSTDMFVESVARALLLMKQSGDSYYAEYSSQYLEKLHTAALWMLKPEVEKTRHKNDNLTHRRWISAAAFGMTGALTGDEKLIKQAELYAKEGLALQTAEGINPEKGGFDITYHNFGILMAERYYLVCRDEQLKTQVLAMADKGLTYSEAKTKANGDVSTEDSTRVGNETDRSGVQKTPAYRSIVQAFVMGSQLTGKTEFYTSAERIARFRFLE